MYVCVERDEVLATKIGFNCRRVEARHLMVGGLTRLPPLRGRRGRVG
jgi:hypothetical protein